MSQEIKINYTNMKREFDYIHKLCPTKRHTLIIENNINISCFDMITDFDKKYGIGSYDELKRRVQWSKWLRLY